MSEEQPYSSTLTGNSFLFTETRIVAAMICEGLDAESIAVKVQSDNMFQYGSNKRLKVRANAILKRLDGLDAELLQRLATGPVDEAKIIAMLAIARSDRLFREFIVEVIADKVKGWDRTLTDAEVSRFFNGKAEASLKISSWTDSVSKKLREVHLSILTNSGMIRSRDDRRVYGRVIDPELGGALARSFGRQLADAIRE